MESFPLLPVDVAYYIHTLSGQDIKNLALVCKKWDGWVKGHIESLSSSYQQSKILKPYVEKAMTNVVVIKGQDSGSASVTNPSVKSQFPSLKVQQIKRIVQSILKEALQKGFPQEEYLNFERLSASHLEDIVKWIEEQNEMIEFAKAISLKVSGIKTILDSLSSISSKEHVQKIREWLQSSQINLATLNLQSQRLKILPVEIQYFTSLEELKLSENKLKTLPTELGRLAALEELDLSENELETLVTDLGRLTQLKKLNLSKNKLKTLPTELGLLTQLEELNLSGNELKTLPTELGLLTQLKKLNLSKNKLETLPTELGLLIQLERLNLSQNLLSNLPPLNSLIKLKIFDLASNNFTLWPENLFKLNRLSQLDFSKNKLKALPAKINQLTQLKALNLSENQFSALPTELGQLTQLEELNVSKNQNIAIPLELKNLPQLRIIGGLDRVVNEEVLVEEPSMVEFFLDQQYSLNFF